MINNTYFLVHIRHYLTGTEWNPYPTPYFCTLILDSIEGITVELRTNEYCDYNAQYEWMQNAMGLRKVPIWDFSVRSGVVSDTSINPSENCIYSYSGHHDRPVSYSFTLLLHIADTLHMLTIHRLAIKFHSHCPFEEKADTNRR